MVKLVRDCLVYFCMLCQMGVDLGMSSLFCQLALWFSMVQVVLHFPAHMSSKAHSWDWMIQGTLKNPHQGGAYSRKCTNFQVQLFSGTNPTQNYLEMSLQRMWSWQSQVRKWISFGLFQTLKPKSKGKWWDGRHHQHTINYMMWFMVTANNPGLKTMYAATYNLMPQ